MASPLTIQPSSKDNYMDYEHGSTNYGTAYPVFVHSGAALTKRILMEFPITWGTDIPVGAIITSASLLLYNYFTNAEGRTYWAYRLLRLDWSETGSSWAYYSSPSGWTSGGASSDGNDYTSADGASATVAGAGAWMSWNVLNQVKAAQTGSLQIAFLIKDETENTNAQTNFYSRNYVDNTTLRPKLVIEYTVPAVSRSFGLIIG